VHNNIITNQWQVATPEPDATITLQRSLDGMHWQTVENYSSLHNSRYTQSETLSAAGTYYYRLQLHTATGTQYSKTNQVVYHEAAGLKLYPNPADNFLIIQYTSAEPLQVYNSSGQKMLVPNVSRQWSY